jgi:endonuclease YncB( thermonuclease family)
LPTAASPPGSAPGGFFHFHNVCILVRFAACCGFGLFCGLTKVEPESEQEIYTVIFLALAVLLFLRLRSVLGQRRRSEWPASISVTGILLTLTAAALGAVFLDVGGAKLSLGLLTPSASTTAALIISGPARVIDGDTVVVAGTTVRLKGVDAAELGTARGENARRMMAALVSRELTCRLTGEKTYHREVGYCTTTDGTDINRAIIAQGAALGCPRFDSRYMPFEQAAALAAQPRSSYCAKRF